MSRTSLRFVAVFIALSASTDGRAWTEAAPHVGYSHCPRDSHTEAYPRNWRRREPTDASPIRPDTWRAPPRATSNATDPSTGFTGESDLSGGSLAERRNPFASSAPSAFPARHNRERVDRTEARSPSERPR